MTLTYAQFEQELDKTEYADPRQDKAKWQIWYNKRVELSQQLLTYEDSEKRQHPRICYGGEGVRMHRDSATCHDCGVKRGMLHVPGCDDEECPQCHGQMISCDCWGDDEEEDEG